MVSVLIQATVWRKVVPESTLEAQKFQHFLGEHPPDPPSCFYISVLPAAESWAGPSLAWPDRSGHARLGGAWVRNYSRTLLVCPRCAMASAALWLRHCLATSLLCVIIACAMKLRTTLTHCWTDTVDTFGKLQQLQYTHPLNHAV